MPDCDCKIIQSATGPYIDRCALHEAAPKLAVALRALLVHRETPIYSPEAQNAHIALTEAGIAL